MSHIMSVSRFTPWNWHTTTKNILSFLSWFLWYSIFCSSNTFTVRRYWCSSPVIILISPLAKVFSCYSCPSASSSFKLTIYFLKLFTPHAVRGGGMKFFLEVLVTSFNTLVSFLEGLKWGRGLHCSTNIKKDNQTNTISPTARTKHVAYSVCKTELILINQNNNYGL